MKISLIIVSFAATATSLVVIYLQASKIAFLESNLSELWLKIASVEKSMAEEKTSRKLQETGPFKRVGQDWVTEDDNSLIIVRKGIIVGKKNPDCNYGDASLSVDRGLDGEGKNCPSGSGAVTFGYRNEAVGNYSSVLGGDVNTASGLYSSVSGGRDNVASGQESSILGGTWNKASWYYCSISGGNKNQASTSFASVSGGRENQARGWYSSILGGYNNVIEENSNENLNEMIPEKFPEERITSLEEGITIIEKNTPFTCKQSTCETEKSFKFLKKVEVKKRFCARKLCQ